MVCSAWDTAAGNVTSLLSIIKLPPAESSSDELVPSGWLNFWFKRQFFLTDFFFSSVHWQKSVFYQWDVCVGRKANSYEDISIFKVRLEELKQLQHWISLTAVSHNWKNYSPLLKYFQCCCRALTYSLLGQFCLPWSTTTRWGSWLGAAVCPGKNGLGVVLKQKPSSQFFF